MFDIGWSEMAVIVLVALVVIGPRDLPKVARTVGKWVAKGRAMAREFQTAIEDMAREAELDKVKSEIEKVGRTNLGKTIENTIDPTGELGKAFDPTAKSRAKDAASPDKPAAEPADLVERAPEPTGGAGVGLAGPQVAGPQVAGPQVADPQAADPKLADPKPAHLKVAAPKPASPKPANGQTSDLGPEAPAAGNGAGSKAPERETAPADPS